MTGIRHGVLLLPRGAPSGFEFHSAEELAAWQYAEAVNAKEIGWGQVAKVWKRLTIMKHNPESSLSVAAAKDLAAELRLHGFSGKEIELIICNAGKGLGSAYLAREFGVSVRAPIGFVGIVDGMPLVSTERFAPPLPPNQGWVDW